ncbi:hypothetical protein HZA57_01060, partial [Candidatus Poribacteria bacterium]|nr:hypothetical protein [Candidatus Poribacteria bacterium]
MKKFLIGCGVLVLLCVIVLVGCIAFATIKIKNYGKAIESSAAEIEKVRKEFPFTKPESGEMDPVRFAAYIDVRKNAVGHVLEDPTIAEFVAAAQENRAANVTGMQILKQIGKVPEYIRFFADTLRKNQMSPEEYGHYARQTLTALRQIANEGDDELAKYWKGLEQTVDEVNIELRKQPAFQKQNIDLEDELDAMLEVEVPPGNLELVREHRALFVNTPLVTVGELVFFTLIEHQAGSGMTITVDTSAAPEPEAAVGE